MREKIKGEIEIMNDSLNDKLSEYAKLVVQVGANLQKGQTLLLSCPVECASFGRLVAEEAYKAGARDVVLHWGDDKLSRMRFLNADEAVFDEVPEWLIALYDQYTRPETARVAIRATDPENLKGVAPDRIRRGTVSSGNALKKYSDMMMNDVFQWCLVSIPVPSWSAKVFPGVPADEAESKLWDAIFQAIRISGDGTSVSKWHEHLSLLKERMELLNQHRFARLIFKNGLGTDLTVELPEKHAWLGGGGKTKAGIPFVANMPTEEIFTLPKKGGVNGVLYSSMPLSLNGYLVKDIKMTFKDGKIVDVDASEGLDVLVNQLDVDEGARYLGEVALVPFKSAISDQGIMYYNTLFDENASCHFAFGSAYPAFVGGSDMSKEEQKANGANDSIIHVDFMVGTPDLSITGITADGHSVPVFADGNFAF